MCVCVCVQVGALKQRLGRAPLDGSLLQELGPAAQHMAAQVRASPMLHLEKYGSYV